MGQSWSLCLAGILHGSHLQRKLWSLWIFGSRQQGMVFEFYFCWKFKYHLFQDEQIVDGKSYSDHNQNNFDCGRYKLLKDLNGGVEENNEEPETLNLRNEEIFRKRRQTDESEEDFVFYFSGDKTDSEAYFCGGTIINDR